MLKSRRKQMMSLPRSGYAPTGELVMYYEMHGSGFPLLLLHRGFTTAAVLGCIPVPSDSAWPYRDNCLQKQEWSAVTTSNPCLRASRLSVCQARHPSSIFYAKTVNPGRSTAQLFDGSSTQVPKGPYSLPIHQSRSKLSKYVPA